MASEYTVVPGTSPLGAKTNLVCFSPADAKTIKESQGKTLAPGNAYVDVNGTVFSFREDYIMKDGTVSFTSIQRRTLNLSYGQVVAIKPFRTEDPNIYLASLHLSVDFFTKGRQRNGEFDVDDISNALKTSLADQFFAIGQSFAAEVCGTNLIFSVLGLENAVLLPPEETAAAASSSSSTPDALYSSPHRGCLAPNTVITFERAAGATLRLIGNNLLKATAPQQVFKPNFDFSKMGIGGMDAQFANIFRRAFAPRIAPPAVLAKMGIKPVKGILLHGPPGTGKTLMARQIGQMLSGREPIVVNGPEILDKYVGESEKKVRDLFAPAEEEWKLRGAESDLHVIVLDELDAICKQRGGSSSSSATAVGDTVVNQFLAKMDGYAEQSNILIIGMTNRKDMIDEALLRPGRLEVHIEVSLPDEAGRLQILKIHTATMTKSGILDDNVSLEKIAEVTKNYSGAELMGLVQNASTYALNRHIDASNPSKPITFLDGGIQVTGIDFERALKESKPSFGVAESQLSRACANGVWPFSPSVSRLIDQCQLFVERTRTSEKSHLFSLLLEGQVGCGKTALAAHIAMLSNFPYVRIISPDDLVGCSEHVKLDKLVRVFDDAYKSPLSLIVIDDIERLIEHVRVGPRFSNTLLQNLLILLKRCPPPGHRLLIIGTSSTSDVMKKLDVSQSFNAVLPVPSVRGVAEVSRVLDECGFSSSDIDIVSKSSVFDVFGTCQIPIKRLIMLAEIAAQGVVGSKGNGNGNISLGQRFVSTVIELGPS